VKAKQVTATRPFVANSGKSIERSPLRGFEAGRVVILPINRDRVLTGPRSGYLSTGLIVGENSRSGHRFLHSQVLSVIFRSVIVDLKFKGREITVAVPLFVLSSNRATTRNCGSLSIRVTMEPFL
jgi:hypothetical protein